MAGEIPEQQKLDRFTRQDELLAQMIPLLQEIRDKRADDLLDLVNMLKHQHEIEHDVLTLVYPFDGTLLTIAAGTTIFDFDHGTVKAPGASVANMSTSLSKRKKEYMRSLSLNADHDIIIQLDNDDKHIISADTRQSFTYQQFQKVAVTVTASTEIVVSASTAPEAIGQSAKGAGLTPFAYESKTIATTSGGDVLTVGTYDDATNAILTLETAQIRMTIDGTAASATVGHIIEVSDVITLSSAVQIANFKGFRTGGTSGVLKATYFH